MYLLSCFSVVNLEDVSVVIREALGFLEKVCPKKCVSVFISRTDLSILNDNYQLLVKG